MRSIPTGTALVLLSWAHLAATGTLAPVQAGSTLGSRISAGSSHTCGVTSAFRAKCWGNNLSGQLGDGTKFNRSIPVNVRRLGTIPKAGGISAGSLHTCALVSVDVDNTVPWCWGSNASGQLGDGTTVQNVLPKKVRGLGSPVFTRVLATGTNHSCALVGVFDGEVWCWGSNRFGQLGDGTKTNRLKPVKVQGLSTKVIDIALGGNHTCALTSAGRVECWGRNFTGELGDGTKVDRLEPVEVLGLRGVTSITTGGAHTCARTSGAVIKCWGFNFSGQLGDGTTETRLRPVKVRGLAEGALHVAAGGNHTCAVTPETGAAKCWGRNNLGQLGDGTTLDRVKPRYVITLRKEVTAITAGGFHTCALKDDRIAKCWGNNSSGQLGDGTETNRLIPVTVLGFK